MGSRGVGAIHRRSPSFDHSKTWVRREPSILAGGHELHVSRVVEREASAASFAVATDERGNGETSHGSRCERGEDLTASGMASPHVG
jgi:hypothetical protein